MVTETELHGIQASTASRVGWIEADFPGPACLFCGKVATLFKPLDRGRLWWCPPCETTWTVRA